MDLAEYEPKNERINIDILTLEIRFTFLSKVNKFIDNVNCFG